MANKRLTIDNEKFAGMKILHVIWLVFESHALISIKINFVEKFCLKSTLSRLILKFFVLNCSNQVGWWLICQLPSLIIQKQGNTRVGHALQLQKMFKVPLLHFETHHAIHHPLYAVLGQSCAWGLQPLETNTLCSIFVSCVCATLFRTYTIVCNICGKKKNEVNRVRRSKSVLVVYQQQQQQ